jgi:hypothetical protein
MKRLASIWPRVLVIALLASGCSSGGKDGHKHKDKDEDHVHGTGPHGGVIFDWGKHHLEFTVSHPKKEVRVYVLGRDEKTPVAIAPKDNKLVLKIKEPAFQIDLKAERQKDDPEGKASCFVGTDDRFGKEQEFAGTVSGVLDDKTVTGEFEEKPD